jgi:hypothetical protein
MRVNGKNNHPKRILLWRKNKNNLLIFIIDVIIELIESLIGYLKKYRNM